MLSKSAGYALKAVHRLAARHPGREPATAGHLAEELDLPENFLSKLLHRLQQEGILESRRGPTGGFRLARPPSDIRLAEVVAPFDDVMSEPGCLLGRPECRDDAPCAAHGRWREAVEDLQRFFAETSLGDLTGAGGKGDDAAGGGREDAAGGGLDATGGGSLEDAAGGGGDDTAGRGPDRGPPGAGGAPAAGGWEAAPAGAAPGPDRGRTSTDGGGVS